MPVPNMLAEVERLKTKFPQAWKDAHTNNANTEGFIKLLAAHLHAINPAFGLNGKRGNPQDISDDAINFKGEGADFDPTDGDAPRTVIDVIGGAGGPNPFPTWAIVTKADAPVGAAWVKPGVPPITPTVTPTLPPTPPPPKFPPYPADESVFDAVGAALFADFSEAHQTPNPQMLRFAFRVAYGWLTKEPADLNAALAKTRKEWRALLGLPPQ
jgi:hypothetical protein